VMEMVFLSFEPFGGARMDSARNLSCRSVKRDHRRIEER
jgi:hypothetical protein